MCERANLFIIKPTNFLILEEGIMKINYDYNCRIGYNSSFQWNQVPPHRPLLVKQFHGCDTIGPVADVFVEFDNDVAHTLESWFLPYPLPAAEAVAGGDSLHDFADPGW